MTRMRAARPVLAPTVLAGDEPHMRVSDIQRARLMAGAVGVIDEFGYSRTTVGQITTRARVSRRTFYELFSDREECLAAVVDDVVDQVSVELAKLDLDGLSWHQRVRAALSTILSFFDREPALARVSVVHTLRAGADVQERREHIIARLVAAVDEGRAQGPRGEACGALTAEGLVGAALAIVCTRLQRRVSEPLRGLLGELMGMIVLPYMGPAAARRERDRQTLTGSAEARVAEGASSSAQDPLRGVRMRLTYRTARVLEGVAELAARGSLPSNRMIASFAGVTDPGQISKLLSRLERLGLLVKAGEGHAKGEPNAWMLTPQGEQVTHSIRVHSRYASQAA
jgi:AcrR family transcriptional regulator